MTVCLLGDQAECPMAYQCHFDNVDVRTDPQAYQAAVASHAANGWRLVQVHVEMPAAIPASVVLILEHKQL
ncbi:hypothetical protein OMW55_11730 [Sphingomonas sp. BN140010]|uniref:DUF4177 domain-containing protein n=1 Tax=Sphingomonas arvum TaxID=2992113 RepID=A0ABT3JIB2_9SPHN|nr:hypothetical protein [Sphingomonas sp. BN140010]MCW3798475.1 hypothetical protein [Sphingomonas sp. BN140010]